ncbi:MAG: thermonuclease family protein [Candidatus Pacebacteria bacterium]|nr:thermonuclease family protein [Candidatus Paceibacterota bacterium]
MVKSILGIIISILLAGGGAAGYKVIRDNGADIFESSVHLVEYVVDGDTLEIENDIRLRLIGVDTPERDQCGFTEARLFLKEMVDGKHIRIEKDISGSDLYDRLLRYVYLPSDDVQDDDVFINEALLRAGHARTLAVAPDNRYRYLFSAAQEEAKRDKKGMWGKCPGLETKEERQADSQPTDTQCTIKGNISEKSFGRTYFVEGCANYNRVKVDIGKGEKYFCTEEEAEEAGFERAGSCSKAL